MQPETASNSARHEILELTVRNHPGVMSHVSGLFARRAYNVEGILCMPVGDRSQSRIWLLVDQEKCLEQMIKQVEKLEDVLEIKRHSTDHRVFEKLEEFFRPSD
jgi:acetolactate synthase-1/3 small subunit